MVQTRLYRSNRKASKYTHNADFFSSVLYFLYRSVELGPRYIALAMALRYLQPWCFILIPFHVIYVTTLYALDKPKLTGICSQPRNKNKDIVNEDVGNADQRNSLSIASCDESQENQHQEEHVDENATLSPGTFKIIMSHIFILLMGIIGIFSFVNLKDESSFKRTMFYYAVFYTENIVIVIVVRSLSAAEVDSEYSLLAIIVGLLCHVVFIFIFYFFCHPTNPLCPHMTLHCCCCVSNNKNENEDNPSM